MSSSEIEEALVPKFSETQFITLISTFPCLYHIHDRNHSKENAALCWDEIGNQLDFRDPKTLKKKWIFLRNKFTKLRRRNPNKSSEEISLQHWHLYTTFNNLFGRFIENRSILPTTRYTNRKRVKNPIKGETNIKATCLEYAKRLEKLEPDLIAHIMQKMDGLLLEAESH